MTANSARRALSVFSLFAFFVFFLTAQEAHFTRITRADGLCNSNVSAVAQDSRGFLWLGTKNGLTRFDGYDFIVYSHDPFNADSLSHNQIQTMFMDSGDILWLGTYRGLNRFDTGTKRFKLYAHDPADQASLSNDVVTSIFRDRSGRLWVGTLDGLNLLDESTGRFIRFQDGDGGAPSSIPNDTIRAIAETRDGTLWAGTYGGLVRYDGDTGSFVRFAGRLPADSVTALSIDSEGNLWAGCWAGGLARIDAEGGAVRVWRFPDNRISSVCAAFDGTVYAGTWGGGLVELDMAKNGFSVSRNDPWRPFSLSSDVVSCLFKDASGLLWVGTNGGGVHKLDRSRDRFDLFAHNPLDPSSISQGAILSVLEDTRGRVWVGTDNGGLNRMAAGSTSFSHYRSEPKMPESLAGDTVHCLLEDGLGAVWAATNEGVCRYDEARGRFDRVPVPDRTVYSLGIDADGFLWFGYQRAGAERFDPRTRERQRFMHDPKNPRSLSDNMVFFIRRDSRGSLWLGTNGGLNRYDPKTDGFVRYRYNDKNRSSLPGDSLRCMLEDSKGRLWFGTAPGGLSRLDQKTGKFEHFTKRDGLPDDSVLSIQEDGRGRLWLGTHYGLCVFDPASLDIIVPDQRDGLQGTEFTSASCRTASGELFFGGVEGLNRITKASLRRNPHLPPVRLTSFKVFDRELALGADIADRREISLSRRENFISIEYAALDYTDSKANRYAYKLEGFDQDWVNAGTRRYAHYTNLPSGSYVFRVKASNNHDVWNEDGVRLRVTVAPSFWVTPAAFVLYLAAAFFLAAAAVAWASREQRLRLSVAELSERRRIGVELKAAKDRAESADRAKTEFLANLSHEIRTPMNAVLGYASILEEKMADDPRRQLVEVIDRSGRSLLALLNDALDLSRIEAGKATLRLSPLRLRGLVSDLLEMFRLRAEEKGLSLSSVIDPELPEVVVADQTKLRQILVNLIGNAIKFTERGAVRVELRFLKDASSLAIVVSDTGIGMSPEAVEHVFEPFYQQERGDDRYGGTGLGLTIVKRLAEDQGGTVSVESAAGLGSTFTVSVPGVRAAAETDGSIPGAAEGSPDDRRLDGLDVLVVEGEMVDRDILARMLESRGAQVRAVVNGIEGLRVIELVRPDAVIADLRMSGTDVFSFLETLRGHPATASLPVVIVTADLRAQTRSRLESLAAETLPKPVERSALLDRLQKLLPGRVVRVSAAAEPAGVPALTAESLRVELGGERAALAVAALSRAARDARHAISAALIVDEWSAFIDAVEAVFVEFGSREIGLYASRARAALASFDVEELARLGAEFDALF